MSNFTQNSILFSQKGRLVLALDSALGGCVCGIFSPTEHCPDHQLSLETSRDQASRLVPMVQDLLHNAGASFDDVGLLVTTVGPGSFTGLRIGLSAAKAFALSLNIPLVGVSSFSAMAQTIQPGLLCASDLHESNMFGWVLLETKRDDFYVQKFSFVQTDCELLESGKPQCFYSSDLSSEILSSLEEDTTARCFIAGDCIPRFLSSLPEEEASVLSEKLKGRMLERCLVDPICLARKGYQDFCRADKKWGDVQPLYLREADVSFSLKKNREILF